MKNSLTVVIAIVVFCFMSSSFAYRHSYGHGYSHSHVRSFGRVHSVRTYTKRNGTVVRKHLAGNPYSGVHCNNNICY